MSSALYLLGNDLRLHDNQVLAQVATYDSVLIVYCVDPRWFEPGRFGLPSMGPHRWRFLKESLADLAAALTKKDQHLFVVYGPVVETARRIIAEQRPDALFATATHGWYERQQLAEIRQRFPELKVVLPANASLFSPSNQTWLLDSLPRHFTPFRERAEQEVMEMPLPEAMKLPPSPKLNRNASACELLDASCLPRWAAITCKSETPMVGGESAALSHLEKYFSAALPSTYKRTRNQLDGWDSSSKWSSWLANGCLSPKRAFSAIQQYEEKHGANDSTYWLKFELLWREFFHWRAIDSGKALFSFQGAAKRAPLTSFYSERFKRWCAGNTPSALVNACMRELSATGYMSNRGRQIVASYLVNELAVDWRYGAAWFEHQLLDYDVGSNWGNWQYIAGVGADPRGGRHFDIAKQQRQHDPDYRFVKCWLGDDYELTTPSTADSVDAADWPVG